VDFFLQIRVPITFLKIAGPIISKANQRRKSIHVIPLEHWMLDFEYSFGVAYLSDWWAFGVAVATPFFPEKTTLGWLLL
jgi:hypothetical protein